MTQRLLFAALLWMAAACAFAQAPAAGTTPTTRFAAAAVTNKTTAPHPKKQTKKRTKKQVKKHRKAANASRTPASR